MGVKNVKIYVCLYALFKIVYFVNGSVLKGCVTFVIDDTDSMTNDIVQVKKKTHELFNAILSSNSTSVDEFILVTFNDPDVKIRTSTKDPNEFRRALDNIIVHGGGDCPEYSMSGIELALEKSKPNSFFYVYTDASAKDSYKYDRIKSLSIKKSTQVTFLLTGKCGYDDDIVYNKLAAATFGEVFHIERNDIAEIIDYIIKSVKEVNTIIGQKILDGGSGSQFPFKVDSKEWDITVSVTSNNPNFYVVGPDGKKVTTTNLVRKEKAIIEQLNVPPGTYTVNVERSIGTSVLVKASTDVSFKHGFSIIKPESLNETATKPVSGGNTYLAILLENHKRDVKLKTVELRDENDDIITQLPLKLSNVDQQFYVTESFVPPMESFKLAVVGQTDSREEIIRQGTTVIEIQDIVSEIKISNIVPVATILGGPKINAEYNESLTVKCKLHAYPKPTVVWEDTSGNTWPATVVAIDLPYDYISVLNLDRVYENLTVTCKAKNSVGKSDKSVNIETKIKTFLNILEYPKDITIPYGETVNLKLRVDAYPSATITWFKDSTQLSVNEKYGISNNNATLIIKTMDFDHRGSYVVQVSNEYQQENITFKVSIHAEIPQIDNRDEKVNVVIIGSNVTINCRLIQGYPAPEIFWYFKSNETTSDIELDVVGEYFYITNITKDDTGIYTCEARNEIGIDRHKTDLIVQYPPEIKENEEHIKVLMGETVGLACTVVGVPTPRVKWFKNNVELITTSKYQTFRDNNVLRFKVGSKDEGVYACEATNSLGKAARYIHVHIYNPPAAAFIDPPEQTTVTLPVGNTLNLSCNARGDPEPEVTWTFRSYDRKIAPRALRGNKDNTITIPRIQAADEGSYLCKASNTAGTSFLAYEVHVTAPPVIVNTLVDKTLTGVVGDYVLRIPCTATGQPKPTITWMIDEGYIAFGTEWYDIESDGTLIIKNLSKDSAGTYKCKAENVFGSDFEEFNVQVQQYPMPDEVSSEVLLEEETSANIECDLPHLKNDLVRWYKNGRLIQTGELYLSKVKRSDSGIYTCRVSNLVYSHSSHKKINVGLKPKFLVDEETDIEFNEGTTIFLGCNAISYPEPTVKWFHNNREFGETSMDIFREMQLSDIGNYTCEVSNEFGSISRTYNIKPRGCTLDIEVDFNDQQPLILDGELKWRTFDIKEDGITRLPKLEKLLLFCPGSNVTFEKLTFNEIAAARCVEKSSFKIKGKLVDFKDLKCSKENKPLGKITGENCGPSSKNTELITVGFNIYRIFIGVYDVCIDKDKKVPIFAKHTMHTRSIANKIPKALVDIKLTGSTHLPFDFDYMYQCISQRSFFDSCCYSKTQLINPRDVLPGLPQVSTYNYLNVVPHWSTCGRKNWDEVEHRVRQLVHDINHDLEVWTGASKAINVPAGVAIASESYLTDFYNRSQPIAPYMWKVVQNPIEKEGLAIIQINIPNLRLAEAVKYIPCKDICHEVEWMRHSEWYDVDKGLTFCCSVQDFKTIFGFIGQFKDSKSVLLKDYKVSQHVLE